MPSISNFFVISFFIRTNMGLLILTNDWVKDDTGVFVVTLTLRLGSNSNKISYLVRTLSH